MVVSLIAIAVITVICFVEWRSRKTERKIVTDLSIVIQGNIDTAKMQQTVDKKIQEEILKQYKPGGALYNR